MTGPNGGMDVAMMAFKNHQATLSQQPHSAGMSSNAGLSNNVSAFGEHSSVIASVAMGQFPGGSAMGEISFSVSAISSNGPAELIGKAFGHNIVRAGDGEHITHVSGEAINAGPMASPKVVGAVSLNAAQGAAARSHAVGG